MLAFQFMVNILWLIPVAIVAFIAGLIFRSMQVSHIRSRMSDLDKDLLNTHAELLELHREKAELEQRLKDPPSPVIPIKSTKEESNPEKIPDVGMRKKLLGGGGNQPSSAQKNQ